MSSSFRFSFHQNALMKIINNLKIEDISEVLECCNINDSQEQANIKMNEKGFDLLGVKDNNMIIGYVLLNKDKTGFVKHNLLQFNDNIIIPKNSLLMECFGKISINNKIFISDNNVVEKIATVADLRKPPVLMLLFGIITLLESVLTDWISKKYKFDTLRSVISSERLCRAQSKYDHYYNKGRNLSEFECLEICDKTTICEKDTEFRSISSFSSNGEAKEFFKIIERLRDNICHNCDPENGCTWCNIQNILNKSIQIFESLNDNNIENGFKSDN